MRIRVTAVLPGAVNTSIWDHYWPDAPREKMMQPEDVVVAAVTGGVTEEIILRPIAGKL